MVSIFRNGTDPRRSWRIGPRLRRSIKDAWSNVPFYRDHWKDVGALIPRMRLPDELDRLPIVTRSDLLRYRPEERCDRRYISGRHVEESSSGSSGRLLEYRMTPFDHFRRRRRFLQALFTAGLRPGQRVLGFSDRSGSRLRQLAQWHDLEIAASADRCLASYLSVRPHVLYGPMSTFLRLGEAIGENGAAPPHRPDLLISTAEQLSESLRRLLQARFQAPVVDFYGMAELGLMAWRPASGRVYGKVPHSLLFEFLPTDVHPDLERLVVTDVAARLMPLVRYDTGDLVRRDHRLPGAPIVEICGREIDAIRLPAGLPLSPYAVTDTIDVIEGIEQFRVVQQPDMSVDIELVLLADADAGRVLSTVSDRLGERLGPDLPIRVTRTRPPLGEPGRKFRLVQSLAHASS